MSKFTSQTNCGRNNKYQRKISNFCFQDFLYKMFSQVYKLGQGRQFSTPTTLKEGSFLVGQFPKMAIFCTPP